MGQFLNVNSCCGCRKEAAGKAKGPVEVRDLPNKKIGLLQTDEVDRFKYLFPFYRMHIDCFAQQLRTIDEGLKAQSKDTLIISIDSFKKAFYATPAWKELWPNVERLLRTPEFKTIVFQERHAICQHISTDDMLNWTTKLEVGILALIWCEGNIEDKARFFCELVNPPIDTSISKTIEDNKDAATGVSSSDDELRFIFVKLL